MKDVQTVSALERLDKKMPDLHANQILETTSDTFEDLIAETNPAAEELVDASIQSPDRLIGNIAVKNVPELMAEDSSAAVSPDPIKFESSSEEARIKEIMTHKILSPNEVTKLVKRIEKGDLEAKDMLVRHNMRLVGSLAKRRITKSMTYSDLINEGTKGLIRAAEKFDYRKGYQFSTYATIWINQAIRGGIEETDSSIRLSRRAHMQAEKIRRAQEHLQHEDPYATTSAETISKMTGIGVKQVRAIQQALPTVISLDTPLGNDSNVSLESVIAGSEKPVIDMVIDKVSSSELLAQIDQLPPRSAKVIYMRFGFGGDEEKTFQEIGDEIGCSAQRARQIHLEALESLKATMTLNDVNTF